MDDPESIAMMQNMAVEDAYYKVAQDHVDHVMSEAGTTVTADHMTADAVVDALTELHHAGYVVEESHEDYVPSLLFCNPTLYHYLRDDVAKYTRMDQGEPLPVAGSEVYSDPHVPEDTALLIHPKAVFPTPPACHERPWDIRDPDGVIVLQMLTHQ